MPQPTSWDRPVLIHGNGPSGFSPPLTAVPADAAIVRLAWFFAEDQAGLGTAIDLLLTEHPDPRHRTALASAVAERGYQISEQRQVDADLVPDASPGIRALAQLLAEGARRIQLCGVDSYLPGTDGVRYAGSACADRANELGGAAVPGFGPVSAAQADRDRAALTELLRQYPDAEVSTVGVAEGFADLLAPAAATKDSIAARPRPGQGAFFAPGHRPAPLPHTVRNGRRCAFLTLVSGDYHHGARALARSLAKVSEVPLIVLCGTGADRAALADSALTTLGVPDLVNPHSHYSSDQGRFAATFTKLNSFRLSGLDRVVFLDSDTIVLQPIDDLFDRDGFWAVRDNGFELNLPGFNSGVFVAEPAPDLFGRMLAQIGQLHSDDGGDQGFLNQFYAGSWQELPLAYNTTKRVFSEHPGLVDLATTKVLHFVGAKPWQLDSSHLRTLPLNDLWLEQLSGQEAHDLLRTWTRSGAELLGGDSSRRIRMRRLRRIVKNVLTAAQWRLRNLRKAPQ